VLAARDTPPPLSQQETLVIAQATPFDVRASWDALAYVYARHSTDRTPSGSLLHRRHSLTVSKRASDEEGLGVRP